MSAPAGLRETLSRVGVSLALHLKTRSEPIYGDVHGAIDGEDTFEFSVWGADVRTIDLADVRSATSPDLGFKEYREIRARQREDFEREHGTPAPENEHAAPRPFLPATIRGGCGDD